MNKWIGLIALLLITALSTVGCSTDDIFDLPDGDTTDGDTPDGDTTDGDTPDGDTPDGDTPDGDTPDGDTPDGDTPDGDTPDGDTPDGDVPDGDTPDGDMPDGDTPDGDTPDGDMPDGDMPDGDTPDGDMPDGDMPDGDVIDGDVVDGDTVSCAGCENFPGEYCVASATGPNCNQLNIESAVIERTQGTDCDFTVTVAVSGLPPQSVQVTGCEFVDEDIMGMCGLTVNQDGSITVDCPSLCTATFTQQACYTDGDVDGDQEPICPSTNSLECTDRIGNHNLLNGRANVWESYSCDAMLNENGPEAIYEFATDEDCEATLQLTNLYNNLDLFVLSSCSTNSCLHYSANTGTTDDIITFNTLAGEPYYVVVDGVDGATGNFSLYVDCTCGVDGDFDGDLVDGDYIDGDTIDGDIVDGDVVDGDEEAAYELQPVSGMLAFFNFTDNSNIFSSPYPNDYYKDEDGYIQVNGFPTPSFQENMQANLLINRYISIMESELDGFGTNAAAYFTFPAAIDPDSLPATPSDSMQWEASVLLVNVDPLSEDYGTMVPIETHWTAAATFYEPDGNQLTVAPYDGFPLLPETTYAVIVTDGVTNATGDPLGRDLVMSWVFSGVASGDTKLDAAYAPLVDWLSDPNTSFDPDRVRVATVFTTHDPVKQTRQMRDSIRSEYPNGDLAGALVDCAYTGAHHNHICFEGHYTAHNFQSGTQPYQYFGGSFVFDDNGDPISQAVETLDFAFCIATDQSAPQDGWPIVLVSHGTGGDYNNYIGDSITGDYAISDELCSAGLATIGINQPLHGARGNGYTNDELELYSFNFGNPESARATMRQSVLDNIQLTAFIKAGKLTISESVCSSWPGSEVYNGPNEIPIDTNTILFHGHSHGGLSGAMLAGIEDDILGYVLSGSGGRISNTVMERTDPDVLQMLEDNGLVERDDMHKFHPLLLLIQTAGEVTDPINYAPYYTITPHDDRAKNVMFTSGLLDPQTPKSTTYALATAALIPQIENAAGTTPEAVGGLQLIGIDPVSRPATNTVQGPDMTMATSGLLQYPDDGHFAIFDNEDAADVYRYYLYTIAYTSVGVLGLQD